MNLEVKVVPGLGIEECFYHVDISLFCLVW